MVFRKTTHSQPKDFFQAEAAGLSWLAATGLPTPEVYAVGDTFIELEELPAGRPTADAAFVFGQRLARCHRAGAHRFGSKPDGYSGGLYIGSQSMPAQEFDSWGVFYAETRVEPFVPRARSLGMLDARGEDLTLTVCEKLRQGYYDSDEPVSRIHGDLWSGNVFFGELQCYAIDPAAHGGHRETDLAMLALFGVAHYDAVLAGYQKTWPLSEGWQQRICLHQLHPLAVHAAGQGAGYGRMLSRAAQQVLADL